MTHHHSSEHPAPGPSEDEPGAGVWEQESPAPVGPPDWFAAVAEEPDEVGPDEVGPPEWFAAAAEEPELGEPAAGELPGLVRASELAGGRRRRRSALGELPVGPARGAQDEELPRERRARRKAGSEAGTESSTKAESGAKAEAQGDPAERARDICLRLLTGAAKSRKQLADALKRREIPDEVAEEVLSRLEEVGLIDDAAFAEAWVESRHAVRGLSRRALAQELRTKGVSGDTAERALAQVDEEDESAAARALAARKLRSTAGLDREVRIRRLVGVLARRGYAEGLAYRVVREALDAEGVDDSSVGEESDPW